MPVQSTPHTQTQQDADATQADIDPTQQVAESGQEEDAPLYETMAGAQTGGTRAFNANEDSGHHPNTEPQTAALDGGTSTRSPEGSGVGITNAPISEESAMQRKLVSQRPDAAAGVDQSGHSVP